MTSLCDLTGTMVRFRRIIPKMAELSCPFRVSETHVPRDGGLQGNYERNPGGIMIS